jgi:FkbM family methyltransferase
VLHFLVKKLIRCCLKKRSLANEVANQVAADERIALKVLEYNRDAIVGMVESYPSLINNGYRHIERAIQLSRLLEASPQNCIIDVGAANGVISAKFSKAFPQAQVFAFEPIGKTFSTLQESVKNLPRILPINKALGARHEEKTIHIAHRITSSSLFDIEKNIDNRYFAEQLEHKSDEKIVVSMLDDEIPANLGVNIIKIDVQGYELEVLKGGPHTLSKTLMVVVEMQNHELYTGAPKYFELDEHLRRLGFEVYDIIPSIREDHKIFEWDGIYVNPAMLKRK